MTVVRDRHVRIREAVVAGQAAVRSVRQARRCNASGRGARIRAHKVRRDRGPKRLGANQVAEGHHNFSIRRAVIGLARQRRAARQRPWRDVSGDARDGGDGVVRAVATREGDGDRFVLTCVRIRKGRRHRAEAVARDQTVIGHAREIDRGRRGAVVDFVRGRRGSREGQLFRRDKGRRVSKADIASHERVVRGKARSIRQGKAADRRRPLAHLRALKRRRHSRAQRFRPDQTDERQRHIRANGPIIFPIRNTRRRRQSLWRDRHRIAAGNRHVRWKD